MCKPRVRLSSGPDAVWSSKAFGLAKSGRSHAVAADVEFDNRSSTNSASRRRASVEALGADSEIDIIGLSHVGCEMTTTSIGNWKVRSSAMCRRKSVWQLDWSANFVIAAEQSDAELSAYCAVSGEPLGAPTDAVTRPVVSVELVTRGSRSKGESGMGIRGGAITRPGMADLRQ